MNREKSHRLERLASQLAETLMTAAICAKELRSEVREDIDDDHSADRRPSQRTADWCGHRSLMSESTLSVLWKSRSLHIGYTVNLRLLDSLARRPNQYITHLDLLREVWDDEELVRPIRSWRPT
jgi:hypothetical protein